MESITLEEAQRALAELVHRLAPGEGVTIVERGRPVARRSPPVTGLARR